MKKAVLWLLLLFLPPLTAHAQEQPLFPIRRDGLWGYMDKWGQTAIPPQWDEADLFEDGAAIVGTVQDGEVLYGLIDETGAYLLEPQFSAITLRSGVYRLEDALTQLEGFYHAASSFYQPPCYQYMISGALILAQRQDGLYGYVHPENSKTVLPFQFDGLYEGVGESEGYVLTAYEIHNHQPESGNWGPEYHLMTLSGEEILFPDGIMPYSAVQEGVLTIEYSGTEAEQTALRESKGSGWGKLYGLAAPDGRVLHEPAFDYVHGASDGCVCFWDQGMCGHMDLQGNVIVPARYHISTGGEIPSYTFHNGYALIEDQDRCVILDKQGNELFSANQTRDEGLFQLVTAVNAQGLIGYSLYTPNTSSSAYGLMKIQDGQVIFLTEPIYDTLILDTEADIPLFPARLNGLWGYVDARGNMVITPAWDDAMPFHHGLARVEKQGKMAYIDAQGSILWQEK